MTSSPSLRQSIDLLIARSITHSPNQLTIHPPNMHSVAIVRDETATKDIGHFELINGLFAWKNMYSFSFTAEIMKINHN